MADDIYCELEIECHSKEKIDEIVNVVKSDEEDFDFNNIIPVDEDEFPADKWDVKWFKNSTREFNREYEEDGNYYLKYSFITAWNPPYKLIDEFSKRFDVLAKIFYYDLDNFGANCGVYEVNAGYVWEDEYFQSQSNESLNFIENYFGEDVLIDRDYIKNEKGEWVYNKDEDEDE